MTKGLTRLRVEQLTPHPENRPLGINEEKVSQIAEMMKLSGYDESKPIKARPFNDSYQIIEGEHRWRAAQKAGLEEVPVFIVELDDEEALIQLVAGNVQTDSHTLDYGYAALRVCKKDSKKGLSIAAFAERLGKNRKSIEESVRAAQVRIKVSQLEPGLQLLSETKVLHEISKCKQSDWTWLHDLVLNKGLSKNDTIEISKRIREIDKNATDGLYNLIEIKKEIANESTKGKNRVYKKVSGVFHALNDCKSKLDDSWVYYEFSASKNQIIETPVNPLDLLIKQLADQKELNESIVYKYYSLLLTQKRDRTLEKAELEKKYYTEKATEEERKEKEEAERNARIFNNGEWWRIGNHVIYCGDSSSPDFYDSIPESEFAFADPPYNADVAEWDNSFIWNHDWLTEKAKIAAVTPGLWGLSDFIKKTNMPYQWTMAYWVNNGQGRGKMGLGNWNAILLYAKGSVHKQTQDFIQIPVKTSDGYEKPFKGRKPTNLMEEVINKMTNPGDIVIDPFLGSGTTLFVCESMGRVFYGAEKNEVHFRDIVFRFEDKFNVRAEKIEGNDFTSGEGHRIGGGELHNSSIIRG